MESLTSSFSTADDGADGSTAGAGDLDLGDFTRFAPFLFGSEPSPFAPRVLALREADTSKCRVSEGGYRRANTQSLE
jgi:hypothetical protein